jgi:hypothetical protein
MKFLMSTFLLLAPLSSFADCSFRITQDHRINDCRTEFGRNCYRVNSEVVDRIAQALKAKGYSHEIVDSTQTANLEIDLAVASEFIPGPPYQGVGFISIQFNDRKHNDQGTVSKSTGVMKRKKMLKKLDTLMGTLPELVSSTVRSCY